jgi:hypothetical protein
VGQAAKGKLSGNQSIQLLLALLKNIINGGKQGIQFLDGVKPLVEGELGVV